MDNEVKLQTVIRTVLLCLALVNQILTSTGHAILPFDDESVTEAVSLIFMAVMAIWSWWKNNSFTKNAIEADKVLANLKESERE